MEAPGSQRRLGSCSRSLQSAAPIWRCLPIWDHRLLQPPPMSLNRTAKGIVLVPSLLLGGAFLAAAVWSEGPAAANRSLAISLGLVLMGAGLLAQLLPEQPPQGPDA